MTLAHLSDEDLLTSLESVCFEQRRLLGRLLLHLIEVDVRRLDRRSACSSMFDFCTRRLGMGESEACRRISAAKLVKEFPCLLDYLECGHINLTALLLLRDHFTTDNVHDIVAAARGKSKREVLELIAARAPKPDVLPTITPLPPAPTLPSSPSPAPETPQVRIEPLAPTRHRLELTVSDEIRAKLERARDLMSHGSSNGNLEAVLDKALDALLAKLEKDRPGDGIPTDVRRTVFARDGEQCTFCDAQGNRCRERRWLELDHIVPKARGGASDAANLRVVCRAHNQLYAEQAFGRDHVGRRIYLRQRRKEDDDLEVVRGALTKMGFRATEVRRTMTEAFPPDAATLPPRPEMIRIALRLLVP